LEGRRQESIGGERESWWVAGTMTGEQRGRAAARLRHAPLCLSHRTARLRHVTARLRHVTVTRLPSGCSPPHARHRHPLPPPRHRSPLSGTREGDVARVTAQHVRALQACVHAAVLPCCHAAMLPCCCAAMLPCCRAASPASAAPASSESTHAPATAHSQQRCRTPRTTLARTLLPHRDCHARATATHWRRHALSVLAGAAGGGRDGGRGGGAWLAHMSHDSALLAAAWQLT